MSNNGKILSRRVWLLGLAAGVVSGFGTAVVSTDAMAAWEPKKPVEFVIMAGKGGGADRLARFIQGIIEKHDLSSKPFVPVNKGGGSGAEALRYVKDKAGDPHVIMATLNSYYTTPLRNPGIGVDIAKFTPIARMAEDTFQLWVHSDTDIKSVDDYVKAVKKAGPQAWKMGGTGKGQEDSLVTNMLQKKFGVKMTYVPFKGGGTVAKNLIGKHINSTVNNPSEQAGFWEAGKSRPLASFTPKGKLKGKFGGIPTFQELGYGDDMVYYMQRSIIAPPNTPKDAQAFYVGVFEKVYNSKEWQDYLKKKGLIPGWLTGQALNDYFVKEREAHRKLLKASGEIK
ncbi:MAG: tripartite tricarboxylate transporter substrate binding protein [Alphaproteobacteria bacterium]|nr:tripartite tricarboxylate transporter substrate binding protein [Alphaproteobacteria bacterium]